MRPQGAMQILRALFVGLEKKGLAMSMTNRENRIWKPFMFSMPGMTADQRQARALVFGLYASAYLNGRQYLQAYKDAELEMIVADYEQKMAALDAEEQKAVLDIVTKRYLARIDKAVHDAQMAGRREQVADDDALMDARFEALQADYKSLETLGVRLEQREKQTGARIAELQAQIYGEDVNRQMVDVDIARAEMDAARKETRLAAKDTELSYKDIEAARTDISIAQKETQILEQNMRLDEKDLQVARAELEQAQKDLQITRAGHDILRTQMQIVETGLKEVEHRRDMARLQIEQANTEEKILQTDRVRLELSNAELARKRAEQSVIEADLRGVNTDADIAQTEARIKGVVLEEVKTDRDIANMKVQVARAREQIAQTPLLEKEMDMAEIRQQVAEKSLEIYAYRVAMAEIQQETISDEVAHTEAVRAIEDTIAGLKQNQQNARHRHRLERMDIQLTAQLLSLLYRRIKLQADHESADHEDEYQPRMDTASKWPYRARRTASRTSRDAAIEAAQIAASADILTTMTHSIGKAD